MKDVDVLVVGAGQAGLAAAYWLKQSRRSYLVVDAGKRIGDSWRNRYRSLTLFTPREFSSLPGAALRGDATGYASGTEFADYLERYAEQFALPVRLRRRVLSLDVSDGRFLARLEGSDDVRARSVIVATGGFQVPLVPAIASGLALEVRQLTTETYRTPLDVAEGAVIVVGDGASGRDIAVDLARTHRVILARGKERRLLPERILGVSVWKWLKSLGLLGAAANSPIGRFMRRADPFPNRNRGLGDLRRLGVEVTSRAVSASGDVITVADGSTFKVGTVIWALGYRDDTSWLRVPGAVTGQEAFAHSNGASPVPKLYFVGRPWQRNRASALIMGAGPDAKVIAAQIRRDLTAAG